MTTASVTLPSPVKSGWTWGWDGKKNRSLKAFFPLSEETSTTKPNGNTKTEQKGVEVGVHHNKDRKEFLAMAYSMTRGQEGPFNVSAYSPMDGVCLARVPVARYSDKALEAAFEQVLADFPTQVAFSEKMTGWFTEPQDES
jgi:hypothetical protein